MQASGDPGPAAVQPDPRGGRLHPQHSGRIGDREPVERHELQERAVVRELGDRPVEPARLALGIETLLDPGQGGAVDQTAPLDPAYGVQLPRPAPSLRGDGVAAHAVQPGDHRSPAVSYDEALSTAARKTSAVRSAARCGSETRRATNRCTASTWSR